MTVDRQLLSDCPPPDADTNEAVFLNESPSRHKLFSEILSYPIRNSQYDTNRKIETMRISEKKSKTDTYLYLLLDTLNLLSSDRDIP